MKTWITLIFLTAVMGWSTANAEYNPDSYVYGKFSIGLNLANEWVDAGEDFGTGLGIGYVRRLTDWHLFGSVRYEYINSDWRNLVHSEDDNYLSHWGLNLEWRHDINQVGKDSYFYLNAFYGPNSGNNWIDGDATGSGYGAGYTGRLHRKYNIFGTLSYEHYSQLMAGSPFNNKDESHLDRVSLGLEWRY